MNDERDAFAVSHAPESPGITAERGLADGRRIGVQHDVHRRGNRPEMTQRLAHGRRQPGRQADARPRYPRATTAPGRHRRRVASITSRHTSSSPRRPWDRRSYAPSTSGTRSQGHRRASGFCRRSGRRRCAEECRTRGCSSGSPPERFRTSIWRSASMMRSSIRPNTFGGMSHGSSDPPEALMQTGQARLQALVTEMTGNWQGLACHMQGPQS